MGYFSLKTRIAANTAPKVVGAGATLGGGVLAGYDQLKVRLDGLERHMLAQPKEWVTADKLIPRLPPGLRSRRRLRDLVAFGIVPQGKCPLTGRPRYDLNAVLAKVDQLIASGVSMPLVISRRRTKPLKAAA